MRYDAKNLKDMANTVRADALRAVLAAHSGHVGIVLGAADIITAVFANFMRRGIDRFVLSAGHGSAMLYATLKLAGYSIGRLESFRKIGGLPDVAKHGAGINRRQLVRVAQNKDMRICRNCLQ